MEEPPECLTDSVDLGPEGCCVHGEGFEPCLSFKFDVREYTLELSDSVSNLSQCRLFPLVFGAPGRGVFRPWIFGRRYSSALPGCLPTHLSFPSLPFGLNIFYSLQIVTYINTYILFTINLRIRTKAGRL